MRLPLVPGREPRGAHFLKGNLWPGLLFLVSTFSEHLLPECPHDSNDYDLSNITRCRKRALATTKLVALPLGVGSDGEKQVQRA